jgi:hypothetical protein
VTLSAFALCWLGLVRVRFGLCEVGVFDLDFVMFVFSVGGTPAELKVHPG